MLPLLKNSVTEYLKLYDSRLKFRILSRGLRRMFISELITVDVEGIQSQLTVMKKKYMALRKFIFFVSPKLLF